MEGPPVALATGNNHGVTPSGAAALQKPHKYGLRGRWLLPLLALALFLAACAGPASNTSGDNSPAASDAAQDFAFTLYQGSDKLGGESLNFSDLKGKPVVLNFWAGLCPPCRAEMPDLQDFYNESNGRVTLVGIDVGQFTGLGRQDDARALLRELGVTYPAGFTNDGSVMAGYKVLSMPTTVFVSPNGEVFRTWAGVLNKEVLTRVTNEMLAQAAGPST